MKILQIGTEETIKKGDHLLWEGERCKDLFFIKAGMLRVYYLKEAQEITDWFGTQNSIVTAMESFHKQHLSDQYIQAVLPSSIIRIRKGDLESAMAGSMVLKDEYLTIITDHLLRVQERIKALQFYTARERYDLLLEKNPEVAKYAQRSQIASYLGISLETLSRVTKRKNSLTNIKE